MKIIIHKYNGKTLEWPDLWNHFGFIRKDKSQWSKWMVSHKTPEYVIPFINDFGYEVVTEQQHKFVGFTKSHLAVVCLNQGFAKLVVKNDPELAIELGIAELNKFPYIESKLWQLRLNPCIEQHHQFGAVRTFT